MAFAPLSFVRNVVAYFYYSVEEVRQDTVNLQLEIIELRKQIDRIDAVDRLQLFETLAPEFECV